MNGPIFIRIGLGCRNKGEQQLTRSLKMIEEYSFPIEQCEVNI